MVSLPYSPDKYYLGGLDWIIHALNYLSRKATGCGNLSQVILRLSVPLDEAILKEKLTSFMCLFPCAQGWVSRDYNLAPYWKYPRHAKPVIELRCKRCQDKEEAFAVLFKAVNLPFKSKQEHVRFCCVRTPQECYFSLVFDHRLFDARGAEDFLFLFNEFFCGRFTVNGTVRPVQAAGLSHWKEKFLAGKRINRLFIGLSHGASVRHIPLPDKAQGGHFQFRVLTFGKDQSQAITDNAYNTAGYLMLAPYLLAVSLLSVRECFKDYLQDGSDFLVPLNTDIRKRHSGLKQLFFNHLSFLLLRIKDKDIRANKEFISEVTRAVYSEMSSGSTYDLEQASLLLRIAPLVILQGIIGSFMRKQAVSFAFSYVNNSSGIRDFCGSPLEEMIHTPRMALMSGIGVFFTQFAGNISVTLSFLKGLIKEKDAEQFMAQLEERLLTRYT